MVLSTIWLNLSTKTSHKLQATVQVSMDSIKKITTSVCEKSYPNAVLDVVTMLMISSLLVQIIRLVHDCNSKKLNISILHSPRTLEKAWLIRRIKQLLPDSHKSQYRQIYNSILNTASVMTEKDLNSVVSEVFSVDTTA